MKTITFSKDSGKLSRYYDGHFYNSHMFCIVVTDELLASVMYKTEATGGKDEEGNEIMSTVKLDPTVILDIEKLVLDFPEAEKMPVELTSMDYVEVVYGD